MRVMALLILLAMAVHHPPELLIDLANVGAVAVERLLHGDLTGALGALA